MQLSQPNKKNKVKNANLSITKSCVFIHFYLGATAF